MQYLAAYAVSLLGGLILAEAVVRWLGWQLERWRKKHDLDVTLRPSLPYWAIQVGLIERLLITTMVLTNVSGAVGFVGAWFAVKGAGAWYRVPHETNSGYWEGQFFTAMMGTAASVLMAIVGAQVPGWLS